MNSSLTYSDGSYLQSAKYTSKDMDGKTAVATRAANFAAEKGIFIVNCAGNESKWVGTPADAPNVLTVGGIDKYRNMYAAASFGLTADGRLKADVLALAVGANVITPFGTVQERSGTSYASPILCGLVACLWQAYPKLTVPQLMEVLRKSGDRAAQAALPFGYGIPDMQKAIELAKQLSK